MGLLLKYQGYPSAVLAALLIHGLILYVVIVGASFSSDFVEIEPQVYINSSIIDANPQRLRRIEVNNQQRAAAQTAQRRRDEEAATLARTQEAERVKQLEDANREEAIRLERENNERLTREAAEKEAELARIREQETINRIATELATAEEAERVRIAANQRAAEQATADENNVQAYEAIIRETVTSNWSIPPSARNGMIVVISLRLVPTGEIVASNIFQGSGDAAFDRSALQAVARAQRFPELQEMPSRLFEQKFRTINLLFRPEDLLR